MVWSVQRKLLKLRIPKQHLQFSLGKCLHNALQLQIQSSLNSAASTFDIKTISHISVSLSCCFYALFILRSTVKYENDAPII
jgi:hypothetical protein